MTSPPSSRRGVADGRSGMDPSAGVRRGRIEPLWDRVDRNRVKVAFFVAAYLAAIALSVVGVTAVIGVVVGLFLARGPETASSFSARLGAILVVAAALGLVGGSAWVAFALLGSEKRLLRRIGAVLTPTGQYTASKLVLKDMAIAAGLDHAPPLWIIPECDRVNAFAVGRTRSTAVIGITQGFADRLDRDDQRAVFANLVARLCSGDVPWATAVSALAGPIWNMRGRDLRSGDDSPVVRRLGAGEEPGEEPDTEDGMAVLLWAGVGFFVVMVTELLLAGHQRQARLVAEKADAEGMLLLKDPRAMLHSLERVLEVNNTVPSAGEPYSDLFYCWAGFGFAPEDDPEFERVGRLREVLGP